MVLLDTFRKRVLDLPEVEEAVHFKLMVFGVRRKNFASFDPRTGGLSLRLPLADPKRMAGIEEGILTPVDGKYGAEGWTLVDLERISKTDFVNLLETAHREVAAQAKPIKPRSPAKSRN